MNFAPQLKLKLVFNIGNYKINFAFPRNNIFALDKVD